jgi:hypothetical protein
VRLAKSLLGIHKMEKLFSVCKESTLNKRHGITVEALRGPPHLLRRQHPDPNSLPETVSQAHSLYRFRYSFCRLCHTSPRHPALQRTNTENSKQLFPEKELPGHSPNFHIHVSVSDLYIPTIDLPISVALCLRQVVISK